MAGFMPSLFNTPEISEAVTEPAEQIQVIVELIFAIHDPSELRILVQCRSFLLNGILRKTQVHDRLKAVDLQ